MHAVLSEQEYAGEKYENYYNISNVTERHVTEMRVVDTIVVFANEIKYPRLATSKIGYCYDYFLCVHNRRCVCDVTRRHSKLVALPIEPVSTVLYPLALLLAQI